MSSKSRKHIAQERGIFYSTTVGDDVPVLESGKGTMLTTVGGRELIDFTSNVSLTNTGLCPDDVASAISQQAYLYHAGILADWPVESRIKSVDGAKDIVVSRIELGKKLIGITEKAFGGEWLVMPECTGALAVNAAGKMCIIKYMKERSPSWDITKMHRSFSHLDVFNPASHEPFRFSFLGVKHAFHGRHGLAQMFTDSGGQKMFGLSSSCGMGRLSLPLEQSEEDTKKEVDRIISYLTKKSGPVLAFFFEPIQGEGGINIPDKKKMNFLIDYLRSKGIVIVADEIQTGLGRIGEWFGCEYFGIKPDMVLLSKSLGAGLPISAVIARKDVFKPEYVETGMHSGSHHWAPVTIAAAIANIPLIEKSLPNSRKMGKILGKKLKELQSYDSVVEVRGTGMMWGVEFKTPEVRDEIIVKANEHGLMLAPCSSKTIRFCPPINIDGRTLRKGLFIFKRLLETSF